jgi:hypothetical protein
MIRKILRSYFYIDSYNFKKKDDSCFFENWKGKKVGIVCSGLTIRIEHDSLTLRIFSHAEDFKLLFFLNKICKNFLKWKEALFRLKNDSSTLLHPSLRNNFSKILIFVIIKLN